MGKGKWITIGIAVVVLMVLLFFWGLSNQQDVLNMHLQGHKNLALHIHPHLEIEINEENQVIPGSIGISNKGMRTLHTHDDSGEIHIESLRPHQFFLKDFFYVWDKSFNETCFEELCSNESHVLEVSVNGVDNRQFGFIPLKDKDRIKIVYRER